MNVRSMQRGNCRMLIMPRPTTWPYGIVPLAMPVTLHDAAAITGYSLATVRRWADGAPMSLCAFRLLMLHVYGLMPGSDSSWQGFRVREDVIITPEGISLKARDLAGLKFTLKHRENLRIYVLRLRKLLEEVAPDRLPEVCA